MPSVSVSPDCLFCRIVTGDLPAEVVRESERTLAFRDIDPQAPVHVLIVTRDHHTDVATLAVDDPGALAELVRETREVAQAEGAGDYRLVFNTGAHAGQAVFHVHGHVLGGRDMHWPPG
jgi:histidine triad (HIT) family protein